MNFPSPLVRGRLVQRYKRFFADVVLDDGTELTAHCPNPGAMLGVNTPGLTVWLSRSDDPKRKLAHTLELVETEAGALTGVNTLYPNRIVAEALQAGAIPELAGYDTVRREVKYGEASRVDFLLTGAGRPDCWLEIKNCSAHLHSEVRERRLYLEVKNVHLSRTKGLAEFPDCVAARSAKHLRELQAMVEGGDRAVVLFVVQREDCDAFSACRDIDPTFATALDRAADVGVEVLVYQCEITTDAVRLGRRVEWKR